VLVEIEAAGSGPFVEDADNLELLGAHADLFADRIGSGRLEEKFVRRVAEHDDVLPERHFGAVEKAPRENRHARAFLEPLTRPEHGERLRFESAIEDPPLCRWPWAGAELDVHHLDAWRQFLNRARVGDREVRPLQKRPTIGAIREARHAK